MGSKQKNRKYIAFLALSTIILLTGCSLPGNTAKKPAASNTGKGNNTLQIGSFHVPPIPVVLSAKAPVNQP